jgi:catechol 2,3-dioxygenase-like lactoylglutathione lyase family enzyme
MSVSALREITIGVSDLRTRTDLFQTGCGLSVLSSGPIDAMTAGRLFDASSSLNAALMGRPDVADSPRLRLVQSGAADAARPSGLRSPGPLGVGFTTRGIDKVHSRLASGGVRFVSPPILLTPMVASRAGNAPPGPQRFEAFGRAEDGDFTVLIERVHAATPYGTFGTDCSEPLHASFVVTNLDACLHFMSDVLEHETLIADTCSGPPFDELLGLAPDVSFQFAMPHRPGLPTGRIVFMQFERRPEPMAQTPSLARGICRLRYDTADLHSTLARVPGGGGSLVRGPASIDDPILGRGLVAMVRSPFGVLIELWQTG